MELPICERCHDDCDGPFSADEVEFDPDDHEGQDCSVCGDEITSDFFVVHEVELSETHAADLRVEIHGCFFRGCAVVGDSEGEAWDDTTGTLWDALGEVFVEAAPVSARSEQRLLPGIPASAAQVRPVVHDRLLALALEAGETEAVGIPDGFSCPDCGVDLDDWNLDVKLRRIIVTLHIPNEIPEEVSELPEEQDHARFIEYYRADCSRFLVHLTRPGRVVFGYENVAFELQERDCTSAEVLWAILESRRIKANLGKGMSTPAVCFTEKPLVALKETLIGHEASRRRGHAISWSPYGLMFDKGYAHERGAVPVLPCSRADASALPQTARFRAVTLSAGSNWLHEREWRCGQDFVFDLEHAVVLLPDMDQVEAFRTALARRGRRVRGFLPLFDLFAFV